ncbi:YeeE/YedE family protein [Devosia sp. XJ19-1]|uniref:YeeE/YedE family protein n=1 Tax=Devosia ureilytica TaxID=2952754 RepID=A0A9Q4FSS1_9HYPH|nr:YeeE/YedE family protein [Devosia ureilytica]MCP8885169.1 YeeE/YedE family protein [Devosia ureilytica]MCP8888891.1 YeeE/YedE family protein [Devosia ureilytica]
MTEFTPLMSLLGGTLIGLSAVLLMAFNGRIAGMTGILTGLLPPVSSDWPWRAAFIAGAIVAPMLILAASSQAISFESPVPAPWIAISGLIAGVGVYFGSGCTSGHGVCGMARLSPRSLAATVIFMATATITVFVVRHVLGGF